MPSKPKPKQKPKPVHIKLINIIHDPKFLNYINNLYPNK
jgi:hypothetical protein